MTTVASSISSPEDGLPHWATGLLEGIEWSPDCASYSDFLGKPDHKVPVVDLLIFVFMGMTGMIIAHVHRYWYFQEKHAE